MRRHVTWILLTVVVLLLIGLFSTKYLGKSKEQLLAERWNTIQGGMTKLHVLSIMGTPAAMSTDIALGDGDMYDSAQFRTVEFRWSNGQTVYVAGFDKNDQLVMKRPGFDWDFKESPIVEPTWLERLLIR